MAKEIKLSGGEVAIVDDEDFDRLSAFTWRRRVGRTFRTTYARCHGKHPQNNKRPTLYMHRLVMGLTAGDRRMLDHRDGNGLNNQKANLRFVDNSQNAANVLKHRRKSRSAYKGIYWDARKGKWGATLQVNWKKFYFGFYASEKEAAAAYDAGARLHFGEFALVNFPEVA